MAEQTYRDQLADRERDAATIRDYISVLLDVGLYDKYDELGWWCHRCDVLALPNPPLAPGEPIVGGDGWCPLCGWNPRAEGPKGPSPVLRGILA